MVRLYSPKQDSKQPEDRMCSVQKHHSDREYLQNLSLHLG